MKTTTLARRIADASLMPLAPEFVAWLRAVATRNGITEDAAWALWKQYAEDCRLADQSAVQFEFLRWNELK